MTRPVCVPCKRFMRPKINGIVVLEQKPDGNGAPAGTEAEHRWSPYKLWNADSFECKGCGAVVVSGFATRPFAEHYQEGFAADLEEATASGKLVTVNDC